MQLIRMPSSIRNGGQLKNSKKSPELNFTVLVKDNKNMSVHHKGSEQDTKAHVCF